MLFVCFDRPAHYTSFFHQFWDCYNNRSLLGSCITPTYCPFLVAFCWNAGLRWCAPSLRWLDALTHHTAAQQQYGGRLQYILHAKADRWLNATEGDCTCACIDHAEHYLEIILTKRIRALRSCSFSRQCKYAESVGEPLLASVFEIAGKLSITTSSAPRQP